MSTADLHEARESLAYWDERAERLPRLALRRRREAREMARRWRTRVAEAERSVYGRGLLGGLLLLAAERRLPEPTRRTARHVARRTAQVALGLAATTVALTVLAVVAFISLIT
jgi:hypothetical protein